MVTDKGEIGEAIDIGTYAFRATGQLRLHSR